MRGRFLGEPALADPGLAGEREQAASIGDCGVDSGADFVELLAPADEGVSAAKGVEVAHLRLIQAETTNERTLTNFEAEG